MATRSGNQALPRGVYWFAALAFILRIVARLHTGAADFWVNSYTFFFAMAQSIAAGKGITLSGIENGPPTAFRVPLYPIFLAGITMGHRAFWPILLAQSLIGAGIALCAALLALHLFDGLLAPKAATIAAGITSIYPYYVIHDTAMQETSLFCLLTLLSIIVLLHTARTGSLQLAALGGLLLGLDVLTRSTIAPFALIVPLWLGWQKRTKAGLTCAVLIVLTVFPWIWRNYEVTGSPTLSTEVGIELWTGNNGFLFRHYPRESSDLSKADALDALSAKDTLELNRISGNEALESRWFLQKALVYIRSHPWLTLINGVRKVAAGFYWLPSPRHGLIADLAHALSYGPIMLLGLWGMVLHRAHARQDSLIYALFATFILVSAVFWAHTSHRVYLDVYWIVFASGALASLEPVPQIQTGV
jgi:hypothetical protein